jgi:DNA-binding transcriptional ArsR family regulator
MRQDLVMAKELLDRIVQEIRERKEVARAAYEESQRLERALAALAEHDHRPRPPGGATRPAGRKPRSQGRPRAARGENRGRVLAVVTERPGVTAGEIASVTGIVRATVSTTLSRLASDGAVARQQLPGGGVGFRVASVDSEGP